MPGVLSYLPGGGPLTAVVCQGAVDQGPHVALTPPGDVQGQHTCSKQSLVTITSVVFYLPNNLFWKQNAKLILKSLFFS